MVAVTPGSMPGLTDTHMHIYEPGYPFSPRAYHAATSGATLADYRVEMARLGIERTVIVHPTAYGADNSCTVAAVASLGNAGRGIAILEDGTGDGEIARLASQGIVGLRCFMLGARGMITWDGIRHLAPRITAHSWHLDIGFDGREFVERYDLLAALPGTIVIEHYGFYLDTLPIDGPEVAAMLRLLDSGRAWIKLSSPYAGSEGGAPHFRNVEALGRKYLNHAPERCVWGSNWPHAGFEALDPDAKSFLDTVTGWIEDPLLAHKLLVGNPAALYGF